MAIINQYSFPLIGLGMVLVLAVFLLRDGIKREDLLAIAALILGLGLAFVWLQPGPGTVEKIEDVQALLAQEKPVLLEFQSQY